ncbi:MAG: 16S rRNA (uracil(1498)-N(3))-methyltransferase [Legionellales bacterium]|nr:16S rRNA (uracil(1498)-N(3))-methyltransferase [Legionellales bacterium]
MRITRCYVDQPLTLEAELTLPQAVATHLHQVLRVKEKQTIILFNGDGHDYHAIIQSSQKRCITVLITAKNLKTTESPAYLHLGQVISRGERMRYTLQKAVELGVSEITPLISARCNVKLDADKQTQRLEHWRNIIIAAAEQSGRAVLPRLNPIMDIGAWLPQQKNGILLDPASSQTLASITFNSRDATILIGSEGGLEQPEIAAAITQGFQGIALGPRILRTETAAVVILSLLQAKLGDLSGI